MLVIFYLGLISAQSACNIRIIYSEKTIGLLRIKMDVFFFCRFIDIVSSREPRKKLEKLNKFIWKSHLDLSVGNCVLWMNTTVAHKLLFHLMASKEAIFIKTAFGSLDASGEITLHKLDLNFLYRKGSCFFSALFIKEGKPLAKKHLQVDWSVDATSAACYCYIRWWGFCFSNTERPSRIGLRNVEYLRT